MELEDLTISKIILLATKEQEKAREYAMRMWHVNSYDEWMKMYEAQKRAVELNGSLSRTYQITLRIHSDTQKIINKYGK